jgi:hypothetical protein
MQTQTISSLGLSILNQVLFSCAVLTLAGCSTTAYHKGDSASASMHQTSLAVQDENRSINATMGALKDLTSASQGDLKPKFQHFSTSLDNTIASCKRADDAARTMQSKCAAYFDAWSKELPLINYQAIRETSGARKDEVRARYDGLNHRFQDTQAVVQPLVAYLKDIRTSLSTDLTTGGIQSLAGSLAKADENATKVQTNLTQLASDLSSSSTEMSSLEVPNTQQATTQNAQQAAPQQTADAPQQTAAATQQAPAGTSAPPVMQAQPH